MKKHHSVRRRSAEVLAAPAEEEGQPMEEQGFSSVGESENFATIEGLKQGVMLNKYKEFLEKFKQKVDDHKLSGRIGARLADSQFSHMIYNRRHLLLKAILLWRVSGKLSTNRPNQKQLQNLYEQVTLEVHSRIEGSVGKMRQELDALIQSVALKLEHAQNIIILVTNNRIRNYWGLSMTFKGWRNLVHNRLDLEDQKLTCGYIMANLVRKMQDEYLMPWVMKAVFKNWSYCRSHHLRTYGMNLPKNITCILPRSYYLKNYSYDDIQQIHMDMEDMQHHHERILAKTLKCYREQIDNLKNAVALRDAGGSGAVPGAGGIGVGGSDLENSNNIGGFKNPRSIEAAFRDASEVFNADDPSFAKQQSIEFRLERLVTYSRRMMQENESLNNKINIVTKQRDRVLALKMKGEDNMAQRHPMMDEFVLRERLAKAEAERDVLKQDLTRTRQQLYAVKEVTQLNFIKTLQKLVDEKSGIMDLLPRNPVFAQADSILKSLDSHQALFPVYEELPPPIADPNQMALAGVN